jgi:O-acetylhomoserine sulfhydrylase
MTAQRPTNARRPETLALHGGAFRADPATGAVAPPIYLTTSYQFRDAEHARRLFALEELGYTYTRTSNPGREVLERRVAALEGGAAALALSDGANASVCALLNLAVAGDNLVVAAEVAEGPNAGLLTALGRLGIGIRLAAPTAEAFRRATDAGTRAYYAESLAIPSLRRFPIAAVAGAGRAAGVPLLVDNSALPLTCRPFEEGAAVAIYSGAGFLGGHGTTDGGVIVDSGTFPWEEHAERLPSLHQPDPSYHGTVWVQVVKQWGASPFVARTRARHLRDFGGTISPLNVFHLIQGVETLPLRVRRHNANAMRVAAFLNAHPWVSAVAAGQGALLAFDLPGTTARFARDLKLFHRSGTFGEVRSTVVAARNRRIVLSIGLEHPDDIAADLAQAMPDGPDASALFIPGS